MRKLTHDEAAKRRSSREFAITDTTSLNRDDIDYNQEVSDTSRSLSVVPRRSRVACVCVWVKDNARAQP